MTRPDDKNPFSNKEDGLLADEFIEAVKGNKELSADLFERLAKHCLKSPTFAVAYGYLIKSFLSGAELVEYLGSTLTAVQVEYDGAQNAKH